MGAELTSPVLVGRAAELSRLESTLDDAIGGVAKVVVLGGEAGVGKSRLVRELSRLAAQRGVRVLAGGCVELGGEGLPLAPVLDVLRDLVRSTPRDELDRLLGPGRRELARLLPELDPGEAPDRAAEAPGAQLLEHVLGLITRLAARGPVLLTIEDLHWADRATLDLVAFLAQTLRELDVLLLLTYRSDELHRRHPLRPLVTAWERVRTVERIDLERFSRGEVAAQLGAIRGTPPTASFVDIVFQRSQGNAFLVEEIVAATDSGADPRELPPSLRDVLLARVETVSPDAQQILRAASAAGPWVEDRLLQAVAGLPEDRWYIALREAVEHHLLVADARGYMFRHALTRDAVYDDMLPGERVRLHAAYGSALSADPSLHGDDSGVAAVLAHHWYAALDLPKALAAAVRAGRQSATGLAPAEALRHLERALQLWPRVPNAAELTGVDWTTLSLLAADAAWTAGEPGRGLSIVDQTESALDTSDPLLRARIVERRAYVLRALGRDSQAASQLREALARMPQSPVTDTHATLLASLANSLMRLGEIEEGTAVARRAVDAAAASGAIAQQADALITLGVSIAYAGDAPSGLAALRDGVALAESHGLLDIALRGWANLSDCLEMLGDRDEAARTARSGIALADRLGRARSLGTLLVGNLAEPLMRTGRWREALDLITEALAEEPSGIFACTILLLRAELNLWQGSLTAAAADLADAERFLLEGGDPQFTLPIAYLRAELAFAAGDRTRAQAEIDAVLAVPFTDLSTRYVWPLVWLDARVAAGDPARLSTVVARAAALPAIAPPGRAYQALVAAETMPGVQTWQAAVETARSADEAYPLCYALARLAAAQVAGGDAAAATATAMECLRRSDDLGATTGREVREWAARGQLRIEPHAAAAPDQFRLTDREREVLALVAQGRSNGQIAAALFISPKTASVHVSNILAKLGVATRTEAAAVAHRSGLS